MSHCTCSGDSELDELRRLVAEGMDQRVASRLLWGPLLPDPAHRAAQVAQAGHQARQIVRTALAAAFPWLRFPREVS